MLTCWCLGVSFQSWFHMQLISAAPRRDVISSQWGSRITLRDRELMGRNHPHEKLRLADLGRIYRSFLVGVGNLDFCWYELCSIDSEEVPKQPLRIARNAPGIILRPHQNHWKIIENSWQNQLRIMWKWCQDHARMMPDPSQDYPKIMWGVIINHEFKPTLWWSFVIDHDHSYIMIHNG